MAKIDVPELDIFYISTTSPNKEEHWADLLNKVPGQKRIDPKGFHVHIRPRQNKAKQIDLLSRR